jgi:hypothetical protein
MFIIRQLKITLISSPFVSLHIYNAEFTGLNTRAVQVQKSALQSKTKN